MPGHNLNHNGNSNNDDNQPAGSSTPQAALEMLLRNGRYETMVFYFGYNAEGNRYGQKRLRVCPKKKRRLERWLTMLHHNNNSTIKSNRFMGSLTGPSMPPLPMKVKMFRPIQAQQSIPGQVNSCYNPNNSKSRTRMRKTPPPLLVRVKHNVPASFKTRSVYVCPCFDCVCNRTNIWEKGLNALRYYSSDQTKSVYFSSESLFRTIPKTNHAVFGREGGCMGLFTHYASLSKHWREVEATKSYKNKCLFDSCSCFVVDGDLEEHLLSHHYYNVVYLSFNPPSSPSSPDPELFITFNGDTTVPQRKKQATYTTSLGHDFLFKSTTTASNEVEQPIIYRFNTIDEEVQRVTNLCRYFGFLHNHLICLHKENGKHGSIQITIHHNMECKNKYVKDMEERNRIVMSKSTSDLTSLISPEVIKQEDIFNFENMPFNK